MWCQNNWKNYLLTGKIHVNTATSRNNNSESWRKLANIAKMLMSHETWQTKVNVWLVVRTFLINGASSHIAYWFFAKISNKVLGCNLVSYCPYWVKWSHLRSMWMQHKSHLKFTQHTKVSLASNQPPFRSCLTSRSVILPFSLSNDSHELCVLFI